MLAMLSVGHSLITVGAVRSPNNTDGPIPSSSSLILTFSHTRSGGCRDPCAPTMLCFVLRQDPHRATSMHPGL